KQVFISILIPLMEPIGMRFLLSFIPINYLMTIFVAAASSPERLSACNVKIPLMKENQLILITLFISQKKNSFYERQASSSGPVFYSLKKKHLHYYETLMRMLFNYLIKNLW